MSNGANKMIKFGLLMMNVSAALSVSNPISGLNGIAAGFIIGLIIADVVNYFVYNS